MSSLGSLIKGTNPSHKMSPHDLIASQKLSLNTITFGMKISTYEFGQGVWVDTDIQTIAYSILPEPRTQHRLGGGGMGYGALCRVRVVTDTPSGESQGPGEMLLPPLRKGWLNLCSQCPTCSGCDVGTVFPELGMD